jgi:hypothetical protein
MPPHAAERQPGLAGARCYIGGDRSSGGAIPTRQRKVVEQIATQFFVACGRRQLQDAA